MGVSDQGRKVVPKGPDEVEKPPKISYNKYIGKKCEPFYDKMQSFIIERVVRTIEF